MPAFCLRTSFAAAGLSLALAVLVPSGAGLAYTPEQQQACTPDAMRLCGEFVPNVDAITACMIQKKAQLSPQCAVYFRRGPAPGEVRAGRPVDTAPRVATRSKKSTKPAKPSKKKKSDEG
jgi:hypothetical protein